MRSTSSSWPSRSWRKPRISGSTLCRPRRIGDQLTKRVLETALEEEMVDHLGYANHDLVGGGRGSSTPRGVRTLQGPPSRRRRARRAPDGTRGHEAGRRPKLAERPSGAVAG